MHLQSLRTKLVAAAAGVIATAALLATTTLAIPARNAHAQDAVTAPATSLPRTITVVGEGHVKVEPDIARVNIGVEVLRPSVREASDANQALIQQVIDAIKAAGVAKEDIQTSGYTVVAERYGANGPLPEDQVNYRVSNNVNITVRALDSVSAVLEAAIDAGANNIYGVEFALDNTDKIASQARAAAVENALTKAQELAGLTNVSVGQVVSVSEVIGTTPVYDAYRQSASMVMGGANSPSIQPGQVGYTLQLQVVYAIEP